MDNFKITINGAEALITIENTGLSIKVLKNRLLTTLDKGSYLEATLYKEASTFVPECNYVFEAIEIQNDFNKPEINLELLKTAIDFFFHSVLDTTYYITRIPSFSNLSPITLTTIENTNHINTSNLYELLSGY